MTTKTVRRQDRRDALCDCDTGLALDPALGHGSEVRSGGRQHAAAA